MSIAKAPIGNAVESVAPDHVVTTADQIFDENLGKYQSEINQEGGGGYTPPVGGIPKTDLASDVQQSLTKADNAVPQTRTVNGKALSNNITLNAGDVDALPSSTTVPTSLSQLADDTTHRTVSDTEKTNWNDKYTKTEVDNLLVGAPEANVVVIDNPSGADPTTLLPLTPAAKTIYRVKSADGTYFSEYEHNGTQYVDLADRQYGIDDKPFPYSNNYVKSGGLFSEMYELIDNKYVNSSGELVNDNNCFVMEYNLDTPIKQGDVFVWSGIESNTHRNLAFFLNDTFKDAWGATGETRTFTIGSSDPGIGSNRIKATFLHSKANIAFVKMNGSVLEPTFVSKIEENAQNIAVNTGNTFFGHVKYSELDSLNSFSNVGVYIRDKNEYQFAPFILIVSRTINSVIQTKIDIDGTYSRTFSNNVWGDWLKEEYDNSELEERIVELEKNDNVVNYSYGALVTGNEIYSNRLYGYTDYIPVSAGDTVILTHGINNGNFLTVGYDSSKNVIDSWSDYYYEREITIPSGEGYEYIRMSFMIGSKASVTINGKRVWTENLNSDEVMRCSIQNYNADKEPVIASLSRHRLPGRITIKKEFVLAHITDTHSDNWLVKRAVDFLNSKEFDIDCLIHTGDIQYYQFIPYSSHTHENLDAYTFNEVMNKPNEKPALTCLGNHDVYKSSTLSELYNRFMKPMVDNSLLTLNTNIKQNETWYYKDFASYSVRLIVLNDYDPLYDGYTKPLNLITYCPSQLQFLVSTLSSTPSGYSIIVASHFMPTSAEGYSGYTIDSEWNERAVGASATSIVQHSIFENDVNPVVDILAAFKGKQSLNKTYSYTVQEVQEHYGSVQINVDYSQTGASLALVLNGHDHIDQIFNYPSHNNLTVVGMTGGLIATNTDSQTTLFREYYGKSQDALNVYCLRPELRRVYIVRIGADFRGDYKEQKTTYIDY